MGKKVWEGEKGGNNKTVDIQRSHGCKVLCLHQPGRKCLKKSDTKSRKRKTYQTDMERGNGKQIMLGYLVINYNGGGSKTNKKEKDKEKDWGNRRRNE